MKNMLKKIKEWFTSSKEKYEMNNMLHDIEDKDRSSSAASNMKTNDFLRLLNINLVKFNYTTTLYTKVLIILSVVLIVLAIIQIFK